MSEAHYHAVSLLKFSEGFRVYACTWIETEVKSVCAASVIVLHNALICLPGLECERHFCILPTVTSPYAHKIFTVDEHSASVVTVDTKGICDIRFRAIVECMPCRELDRNHILMRLHGIR